jgi:hypothetical protein
MPYNLTFDNPYNREVVNKLKNFRNKQQGYFVPTYIEPEHIFHHYDPITITGGSMCGASSYHAVSRPTSHYPADLFEPRYTFNRNQMLGNRKVGGSSDFLNDPFYAPVQYNSGTSYDRKDNLINDLGAIHSKRRAKSGMVHSKKGGKMDSDSESDNDEIFGKPVFKKPTIPKNVLDKLKKITGGKKQKKEKKELTSKLLKIFN